MNEGISFNYIGLSASGTAAPDYTEMHNDSFRSGKQEARKHDMLVFVLCFPCDNRDWPPVPSAVSADWEYLDGIYDQYRYQKKEPKKLANKIIEDLKVVTPDANTPVRRLSGGNVQKVLVGREIAASPTVLMAAYPVRGLDINSSYTIYNLLTEQKEKGVAVIFVGEDLDVLIDLCDRILVLSGGRVTGIVDGRSATKEEIGLLMTKSQKEASDNE